VIGNSTPIKESLMFVGICVHFHYIGQFETSLNPFLWIVILRHALMGCIQDLRDVAGDIKIGRTTLPILCEQLYKDAYSTSFMVFYIACAFVFYKLDLTMTIDLFLFYVMVALCGSYNPNHSYMLWQLGYVFQLGNMKSHQTSYGT
jgi:4-hydroxybenzoate polyprenyltransferase